MRRFWLSTTSLLLGLVATACAGQGSRPLLFEIQVPPDLPEVFQEPTYAASGLDFVLERCEIDSEGKVLIEAVFENSGSPQVPLMTIAIGSAIIDFLSVQVAAGGGTLSVVNSEFSSEGRADRLPAALTRVTIGETMCALNLASLPGGVAARPFALTPLTVGSDAASS